MVGVALAGGGGTSSDIGGGGGIGAEGTIVVGGCCTITWVVCGGDESPQAVKPSNAGRISGKA
jgi:hypothetical protein